MADHKAPQAHFPTADGWRQIAGWLAAADIDCIEVGSPGHALRMVRGHGDYRLEDMPSPVPAPEAAVVVEAPCAGILLHRHPAGGCRFAQSGDRVRSGDLIGLLQIGLVLAPVVAPVAGTLGHMLVAHATLVGYGTPLTHIAQGDA